MNTQEMIRLVDAISRERNVDPELLFTDIEQAMVSAARRHFNALDTDPFSAHIDRKSGAIRVWRGEEEIPLAKLGRIPAQTAKQVMIQRFREDERDSIYSEFMFRVGELVTGMAQRYEGGALIVQIERAEAFMPRSEQIRGEQHQPGERVRCMILAVREAGNQVKIVVSRGSAELIRRLFEVEVPEVAEGVIQIRAMAREPGQRTKIAVVSADAKVDAVGACVGVRGSRIKNIVDELGGEKIDIVRWNESSQVLIQNALKPAEVVEISLCFELGRATVVVQEDQLSLAIGKRGQNVRLAARLTGWDVDIMTPEEFSRALDIMDETLRGIEGVSEEHIDRLGALGIISVLDVEEVGAGYLAESLECEPALAEKMVEVSAERAKEVAEEQRKAAEAAKALGAAGPAAGTGGDIVEMLESRQTEEPGEADAPAGEAPRDAALAGEAAGEADGDGEGEKGDAGVAGEAATGEGEVLEAVERAEGGERAEAGEEGQTAEDGEAALPASEENEREA